MGGPDRPAFLPFYARNMYIRDGNFEGWEEFLGTEKKTVKRLCRGRRRALVKHQDGGTSTNGSSIPFSTLESFISIGDEAGFEFQPLPLQSGATFCYRPKGINEDKWIPLRLKWSKSWWNKKPGFIGSTRLNSF